MKVLRNVIVVSIIGIISACSSENEARVSFYFSAEPVDTTYSDTLRVQFSDGTRTRSAYVPEFLSLPHPIGTEYFSTELNGDLMVKFRVFQGAKDSIAAGQITLDLRPDWSWEVDFIRGETNPYDHCFGCFGYQAFPIDSVYRQSVNDSVFVIWGGNSISNPVIY